MQQKRPSLRRACFLLTHIVCLLFSLSTHAQSFTPVLTVQPGNSFIEGKGLYVLGGGTVAGTLSSQTFMIDLSVSWNTTSPTYKSLPTGPFSNWFPSAISADERKWFVLIRGQGYVFDFQSNQWNIIFNYPDSSGTNGWSAATDPVTGKVFIPYAYKRADNTKGMLIVDLQTNNYTTDSSFHPLSDERTYSVAWNAKLKSLLLVSDRAMYTYGISDGWKPFGGPQGLVATNGYCMASSSSGSKVVLFGGYASSLNATVGDIFILDVPTLKWKKGTSTPPRDVRRSPACALSNDYFVVWGGDTGNWQPVIPADNTMLVYDLETDKWVPEYFSPKDRPRSNDTSSGSGSGSGSSANIGIIVGAICGGLAIGLALGGLYEYRARKRRSISSVSSEPTKPSSPAPTNTVHMDSQPNNDRPPGKGTGGTNRRTGAVQFGSSGSQSEPEPQHPQGDAPESQPVTHDLSFGSQAMSQPTQPMGYGHTGGSVPTQPMGYYPGGHTGGPQPIQAMAYRPDNYIVGSQPMVQHPDGFPFESKSAPQHPHTVFVVNNYDGYGHK